MVMAEELNAEIAIETSDPLSWRGLAIWR